MKAKYLSGLFIFFITLGSVLAQTTTPEMKEFADANYLQIDRIDVPKGIQRVEEQLRENVIDVIIHSKTHMPIFAQKREEGYSKNYKKFYGLNIKILPILGDEDFYSLELFYFNWTTNKFDKKLVKKISKYNVLNELRFATYEMLLGKQWVLDHKDHIESRNFERIQAVREVVTEQEKLRKKKKKEEEIKKSKKEEEEDKKSRNLIKREEREKRLKKETDSEHDSIEENLPGKNKKNLNKKGVESDVEKTNIEDNAAKKSSNSGESKSNNSNSPGNLEEEENTEAFLPGLNLELPQAGTPKKTYLYGFSNYFQENTEATGGLINSNTTLKYIGLGGRFILERETFIPSGVRISFQAAMPIFKEKYTFPIYRGIESEFFASRIFNHFQLYTGMDFVPVYFVGLPTIGSRFQVYENDFLWMKVGIGFNKVVYERNTELRFSYLKSLLSKSNQSDKFEATKVVLNSYAQLLDNHGAEINFSTTTAAGAFNISSSRIAFSYVYKFEN